MKKIIIPILLMFFISCSDDLLNSNENYDVTFINDTSYDLTISDSYGDDFNTFNIASGETKIIKSKSKVVIFDISHSQTSKIISYESLSDAKYRIYEFNYTVQYKISGTANSVDVTLNNSSGGTEQYSNVSLPKTYSYKNFDDDFLYISAQNQGASGSVTVAIYYEDLKFKSSSSSGAYVIATASGSKP